MYVVGGMGIVKWYSCFCIPGLMPGELFKGKRGRGGGEKKNEAGALLLLGPQGREPEVLQVLVG